MLKRAVDPGPSALPFSEFPAKVVTRPSGAIMRSLWLCVCVCMRGLSRSLALSPSCTHAQPLSLSLSLSLYL